MFAVRKIRLTSAQEGLIFGGCGETRSFGQVSRAWTVGVNPASHQLI